MHVDVAGEAMMNMGEVGNIGPDDYDEFQYGMKDVKVSKKSCKDAIEEKCGMKSVQFCRFPREPNQLWIV